ncbi:MAG: hypothetical protein JO181_12780 [Solirubrobacterales bacterium]|nr:hypothetical protein [Solirubrobacterales bacterium]
MGSGVIGPPEREPVGTPAEPEVEAAPSVGAAEEALRALQERLDAVSAAAERVIADAARAAPAPNATPPPAGWQLTDGKGASRPGPDLEALVQFVQSLRDLIPPDVQRRVAEAVREVLLAIRALIDSYLERLDSGRSDAPEIQDIPIL